jgi:hypothetical protein
MDYSMTDEEQFFAWLDGELDDATAAQVAARVAADPILTALARDHQLLGRHLRGAFEPLMTTPVPDHIAAPPSDLSAARERRAARGFGLPQWAAIAATLVVGIGLGNVVGERGGHDPVTIEGGRMIAAGDLDKALDTQLASSSPDQPTRIGLTFRNQAAALCRSFQDKSASGLACRDGKAWRIEGMYGASPAPEGTYRMAAGADPRLSALIDSTIAGEPLDAAGERAALEKGWR